MNLNIADYCKVYKNFIDEKQCDIIVEQLENVNWNLHSYRHGVTGDIITLGEKELSVSHDAIFETPYLMDKVHDGLRKYILELNFEWLVGWAGYSQIRFNKYDKNTMMNNHCDHINSIFDGERKGIPFLTVLMSLNNDYTGGEFIMWEDTKIELDKGDIVIFPSNFLYPHKVLPVTQGTRYTCISWFY